MSTENGDSNKEAIPAIIAKLRSQILLFSLAIALVIVSAFGVSGQDAMWPIAAVLLVFLVGASLYVFVEKNKDSRSAPEKASIVSPSKEASSPMDAIPDSRSDKLKVEVWVKPAHSDLAAAVYKIGENIRICVRATTDAYLTLLNIGSDGELTVLFPNKRHQDNHIQMGETYEIPAESYAFDFILEGPVGEDIVKAIVTLDPEPLLATDFNKSGEFFYNVSATATPRTIKVIAREVAQRENRKWAASSTRFKVEEA